jgi:[acyl-carrier-protein] S-malonyltransferase
MIQRPVALMFPGQGSQSVGMLAEWAEHSPIIVETFQQASSVLGYDLWQRVQQGPSALLNQTACAQPALLTASVALWRLWQQQSRPVPALAAGHSLGEYSALVCAEAVAFEDAVWLVEQRGRLMQAAQPEGEGAMVAVLGLTRVQVDEACERAAQHQVVSAANVNAPEQVVIAGHHAAVERAMAYCRALGAKRLVPLAVTVPAHCALMKPVAEKFAPLLDAVTFQSTRWPVVNNVDVQEQTEPSAIKEALIRQLYSPVRWYETLLYCNEQRIQRLFELGPGTVLTRLANRTLQGISAMAFQPILQFNEGDEQQNR